MERLGPRGEPGPDLEGAHDRLEWVDHSCDRDQTEERRIDPTRAATPPRDHPGPGERHPDHDADVAVERVGEGEVRGADGHVPERRDERATHERPVREDERRGGSGHVRAVDEQDERGDRRERDEQGETLAPAAPREPRRVARPHEQERKETDNGHGRRKVRGHRRSRVAEAHGLAAKPGLEADERHEADGRRHDAATIPVVDHGQDHDAQRHHADDRGDETVNPLRPGLELEGRDHLAVAEGPVRAAEPGAGRPDDDPDDDEGKGHRQRRCDELLEAGHRTSGNVTSAAAGRRRGLGTAGATCSGRAGRIVPCRPPDQGGRSRATRRAHSGTSR